MVLNEEDNRQGASFFERFCEPLNSQQRSLLEASVVVFSYERGDTIFSIGDPVTHVQLLLNGRVTLFGRGIGGRMHVVRLVRPAAIFGFQSAFTDGVHITTAVACEPLCVAKIPINLVNRLIRENGDFALLFIREMATLLGTSAMRIISMTQKHIRGRLAETLLSLRQQYGVESDGLTLAIYISREELASTANMTTSNAIRTLSAFAHEGIVAIVGRRIQFLDVKALERISEMG